MAALRNLIEGKPAGLEGKPLERLNEKIRTGKQL